MNSWREIPVDIPDDYTFADLRLEYRRLCAVVGEMCGYKWTASVGGEVAFTLPKALMRAELARRKAPPARPKNKSPESVFSGSSGLAIVAAGIVYLGFAVAFIARFVLP